MYFETNQIAHKVDPRIQFYLELMSEGMVIPATCSTSNNKMAILAKVSDLTSWLDISEVSAGADLGKTSEGAHIVTAKIPLARVEALMQLPYVQSIQVTQPLKTTLGKTVQEIGVRTELLPKPDQGQQGQGTIVGIIDTGCDFLHRNFRNSDGTSRILKLWDQTATSDPTSPFGYGKVHTQAEINAALTSADTSPFITLGYSPGFKSHGTHVMDIACGNGLGSGVAGIAPQSDIIFVHLSKSDVAWVGTDVVDTDNNRANYGSSSQLIEAICYIFEQAGNHPCVINVSLGTNGGPHDGTNLVEQAIDVIVQSKPNRAVVVAASNSFADGIHAQGRVAEGCFTDLIWEVGFDDDFNPADFDFTHNEMEIWYSKVDQLRVELIDETGQTIGLTDLGTSSKISNENGELIFFIAHNREDPLNGDNSIGIFMNASSGAPIPPSKITVRLHGISITDGNFHAWIERDDDGPSRFASPHDSSHTLSSIACGKCSIVVGSYDAYSPGQPISDFSSAGPTRDKRQKPEISAPGHNVMAASSASGIGVTSKSGTSMAAPAVSGVIALMLAEARNLNKDLSIEKIREVLAESARSTLPDTEWHARYGKGRIDANLALQVIRKMVP
ncbi:MAG: S8 family peptidase [Cyanobacteria bacterium P01_D01_bin.156]